MIRTRRYPTMPMQRVRAIFLVAFFAYGWLTIPPDLVAQVFVDEAVREGKVTETPLEGLAWDLSHGPLRVADNGRFLVHEDGTPFWYQSDTNWELFHRARREDAERLLDRRRGQGFTVVFAPVTGALDCMFYKDPLNVPNAYGDLPFHDRDVTRPAVTPGAVFGDEQQYDYWDHVDYVIGLAEARGMFVAIVPGWQDHYVKKFIRAENARGYGRFLGERFGARENVIWVLGGDTHVPQSGGVEVHNELAAGIKEGEAFEHLMSFHPRGGRSSSQWLSDAEWIDFHMIQSGHGRRDLANYRLVEGDYRRTPAVPTLDGENRYEDHAVNWNTINGWFNHFDNRQAAYWSVFAGSFGHVYGTRGVWQMWEPGREKYTWLNHHWYDAMELPGGWDMQHVRALLLSRPFATRQPDQSLLAEVYEGADHLQACRGDGYAMVYTPTGKPLKMDLSDRSISGDDLLAWWFNPRTGVATKHGNVRNGTTFEIKPPHGARGVQRGNDWVLVLDDAARNWPAPGAESLLGTSSKKESPRLGGHLRLPTNRIEMVLDTDAYNEVDDQFALTFAVNSSQIDLKAVTAAPFKNHRSRSFQDGMEKSYDEIQRILTVLKQPTADVYRGAAGPMKNVETPSDSPAARKIIELAHQPRSEPLYVVGLGMATNIASALTIDPTIANRIVVVWIGGHPYHWKHARDFNLNQDIAAAKVLFDSAVPLVHIPAGDVAAQLRISLPELAKGIRGKSQIADELYERVAGYRDEVLNEDSTPEEKQKWTKVIWDIATIAWLLDPQQSVQTQIVPRPSLALDGVWQHPNDASKSSVRVATDLDAERVFAKMFSILE